MKKNAIMTGNVYLSLGDREEKVRNPVMATVGDRIRETYQMLKERGVNCILEWNNGNHFKDADIRTAKAFAWVMNSKNAGAPGNSEALFLTKLRKLYYYVEAQTTSVPSCSTSYLNSLPSRF